ncbi:MAG: 6-pyruvoyl-tetrahydropterin synthase-related protein [Caldilineaceae bacterium]
MSKSEVLPAAPIDSTHSRLAWRWADAACVGLVVLVAGWLAAELMRPGVQNYRDALMSVYRVFELDQAWQRGVLYPRLAPNLNFGLGAPLFQFYPPLAAYVGLLLHKLGLGFLAATKATMALALLAGGLGVYGYVRWLTAKRLGATAAALLFLLSPYVLLTTFERGAAAEGAALAILPWLVWAMHRLLYDRRFGATSVAALLVAAAMLAHNVTALFVLPAVLAYAGILAAVGKDYAALGRIGLAFAFGLGLSAFYWIPALAELRYTRAETMMLQGVNDVTNGLVAAARLVQDGWTTIYSGDDRFRYGLLMFIYGIVGLVSVPWQARRLRLPAALLAGAWVVILLLQLREAEIFWQQMPLVRFIQFPWRLYGLATFCTVVLLGMLLSSPRLASMPRWLPASAAVVLVAGAVFAQTPNARVEALTLWTDLREQKVARPNLYELGRLEFPLFTDYTPISMATYGSAITQSRPQDAIERDENAPAPAVKIERVVRNGYELGVNAPTPFALKAPRAYFPGWQVYVDGAPVSTAGSGPLGLVTAEVPAGEHKVRIEFDQTPVRTAADFISLLTLAGMCVGVVLLSPLRRKAWWLGGLAVAGAGIVLLLGQMPNATAVQPVAYGANLDDEVQLIAYQIDHPVVQPGEKLDVKLYWYVQKAPADDRKVFIHINLPDDSGRVAQNDQTPLLSYYPTTQWEGGQIFADEYRVEIPPETPAGRYVVTAGMYHPDPPQNLPVLAGPNTWPGDRMVLGEVEVTNGR